VSDSNVIDIGNGYVNSGGESGSPDEVAGVYVFHGHLDGGECLEIGIHAISIASAEEKLEALIGAKLDRIIVGG